MAVLCAAAVTAPGCDDPAACAVSAPVGLASAATAVCRLMRLLFVPASRPSWVAKVVCCACQTFNWPLCEAMICCTRELTLMPCPERIVEGLKLMPIRFSSFDQACSAARWLHLVKRRPSWTHFVFDGIPQLKHFLKRKRTGKL